MKAQNQANAIQIISEALLYNLRKQYSGAAMMQLT